MKLKHENLQEGDVFFTVSFNPFSWLTSLVTGKGATHCGFLIDALDNGRLYCAEMNPIGKDIRGKHKYDLKITSMNSYLKWNKKFVAIKRYDKLSQDDKMVLRRKLINAKLKYDWREVFSYIGDKKDDVTEEKVCSKLVFEYGLDVGIPWRWTKYAFAPREIEYGYSLDKLLVSPNDLLNDPILKPVDWRM